MKFELNEKQQAQFEAWEKENRLDGVEKQKLEITPSDPYYEECKVCWDMGFPYTGAIGGSYTYSFTPTSIGTVVKVKDSFTGNEIDLSDYDQW